MTKIGSSLINDLHAFRNELVRDLEGGMGSIALYAKGANEKHKTIEKLIEKVLSATPTANGDCDLSADQEGKDLIDKARTLGIPLAQKYSFTKVERDELVDNLKAEGNTLETELNKRNEESKASIERRKVMLDLISSIIDTYNSIIKEIAYSMRTSAKS